MKAFLRELPFSLVIAACFLLVFPLQTFLAYSGDFEISWSELLPHLMVGFALCWIVLAVASAFRSLCLSAVLLAIVTGAILESGFLSIGLPELNGNLTGYRVISRMIWDGAVWLAVLAAFLIFRSGIAKYRMVIALALLLYASAAFFDVHKPSAPVIAEDSLCVPKIMMRSDVVQSVRYSPTDNVIVLILDSISAEAAHDIFAGDSSLKDGFPGFVNYTQNIGMHWSTATAIPSMMTGRYLPNGRALVNCYADRFARDSAIADYLVRDIPTFANFSESRELEGYTNRSLFSDDATRSSKNPPKTFEDGRMQGLYPFTVCELTLFRCIPYALKGRYLDWFASREAEQTANEPVVPETVADRVRSKSPTVIKDLQDDNCLWPLLSSRPVDANFKKTFQIHHSRGGHPPLKFDADGHRITIASPTYLDYLGTCKFSFRQVCNMFNVWRTNGVYDASTIILLADHSCYLTSAAAGRKCSVPFAFPFLMVKPHGASTAFCESTRPTTHAHVADLMRALCERTLSRDEIENILSDDRRMFRIIRNGKVENYTFNESGSCDTQIRNDDCEPDRESLRSVTNACEYSFGYARAKAGAYPDFILSNGLRWEVPVGILHEHNPMMLTFKYARPMTTVGAVMRARIKVPRGKKMASVKINGKVCSFQKDGDFLISVPGRCADKDGYLTYSIECDESKGFYDFLLYGITFREEHDDE